MSGVRVAELAVKRDEAGPRQEPELFQAFWPALEERNLFPPAWPDRLDKPLARP